MFNSNLNKVVENIVYNIIIIHKVMNKNIILTGTYAPYLGSWFPT